MRRHHLVLLGGLFLSASGEFSTGPQLDSGELRTLSEMNYSISEPVTYHFADLPDSCNDGTPAMPNAVGDLTFVEALFAVCTFDPAFLFTYDPSWSSTVTNTIRLPRTASVVAIDGWWHGGSVAPTIRAFDEGGNPLGSSAWNGPSGIETHSVSAEGIAYFTVTTANVNFYLYNITVTYVPTGPANPTNRYDCMQGSWAEYGFQSQGQCIRFVETGKDSRV